MKGEIENVRNPQAQAMDDYVALVRKNKDEEVQALKLKLAASGPVHQQIGFLRRGRFEKTVLETHDAIMLYQMYKTKSYREAGMTWEEVCQETGYSHDTVERIIRDIAPIVETYFHALRDFYNLTLQEFRYLGRALSAGCVKLEDVPKDPEEIKALIDHLKEEAAEAKNREAELNKKVERGKVQIQEVEGREKSLQSEIYKIKNPILYTSEQEKQLAHIVDLRRQFDVLDMECKQVPVTQDMGPVAKNIYLLFLWMAWTASEAMQIMREKYGWLDDVFPATMAEDVPEIFQDQKRIIESAAKVAARKEAKNLSRASRSNDPSRDVSDSQSRASGSNDSHRAASGSNEE